MYKKLFIINLLIVIFALSEISEAYSQFYSNPRIGAGVITMSILGDNKAKLPMVATNDDADAYTGGSFEYVQPGITLRSSFADENDDFRYGLGLDYFFFSGRERINITGGKIVHYLSHDLNILAFGPDVNYVLANLGFANAKLYAGLEAKLYYIHNISAEIREDWLELDYMDNVYKHDTKANALRVGGSAKVGVEGRLRKNFYVNAGFAMNVVNMLGRDDERGELLTPLTLFEDKENFLSTYQVFIILQYHL